MISHLHIVASFLLACVTLGMLGCIEEERAQTDPPLRPLVYTETPGDTKDSHAAQETALLKSYVETGKLPSAEEMTYVSSDNPAAEEIGDNILGELVLEEPVEEAKDEDAQNPEEEAPPEEDALDLSTPEALGRLIFEALVNQDEELYQRVLIDEQGLIDLTRVKPKTAKRRVDKLRKAAQHPFEALTTRNPSEEPVGGLASKVEFVSFKEGKAGTIWGRRPRRNEETVQHWSNTLQFQFKLSPDQQAKLAKDPDAPKQPLFSLNVGRILKVPSGQWRLAAAPQIPEVFQAYLQAGLHLKPEMLLPEHHPYPLSVGNFWRYRIQRPEGEVGEIEVLDATAEEVRLEVTQVDVYDGYRIVTLRRTHKHAETTSTTLRYMVTARRLYFCTRYCAQQGPNLGYMISYNRFNSPQLMFPLKPGMAWRTGGTVSTKNASHQVRTEQEMTVVPAGQFSETFLIDRLRKTEGTETRYFKPGIGTVKRISRDKRGPFVEELIEYRILTTE